MKILMSVKEKAIRIMVIVASIGLVGCGNSDGVKTSATGATEALKDLRSCEMQLSGDLLMNETILAFEGNSGALENLDLSDYAEKMEKYDSVLKYTNLQEWMALEDMIDGIDSYDPDSMTISDEDYEKLTKIFYQLDKDEQSKVLRHMFLDTGYVENRTVPLDYDYVPVGHDEEEEVDITEYQVTNRRKISVKIYSDNPLIIEIK